MPWSVNEPECWNIISAFISLGPPSYCPVTAASRESSPGSKAVWAYINCELRLCRMNEAEGECFFALSDWKKAGKVQDLYLTYTETQLTLNN